VRQTTLSTGVGGGPSDRQPILSYEKFLSCSGWSWTALARLRSPAAGHVFAPTMCRCAAGGYRPREWA